MLLVKLPEPEPLIVLVVRSTVGLAEVLQQTPRAVTVEPPVEVTLPPPKADDEVIEVTAVVVMDGLTADVVKIASSP